MAVPTYWGNLNDATLSDSTGKSAYAAKFGSPFSNGVLSVFNVKDYGAVGNNVTDDSAAILAAIAAAAAAPFGGMVFFPSGAYVYNSATAMVIPSTVSVRCAYPVEIGGGALAVNGFQFNAGPGSNIGRLELPAIFNFPGAGIFFNGCVLNAQQIYTPYIDGCGVGVRFDASAAHCNNCTVVADVIVACGVGVLWTSTSTNNMQECNVFNAYIVGSTSANLKHDYPTETGGSIAFNGVYNCPCDGTGTTPYGLLVTSGTPVQYFTIEANYFHNYATAIFGCLGTGSIIWSTMKLGLSSSPSYAQYLWGSGGSQTIGSNLWELQLTSNPGRAYITSSAPNSRSSWNAGTAVPWNEIPVRLNIPVSAAGDVTVQAAYSPLAVGGVTNLKWTSTDLSNLSSTSTSTTLPAAASSVTINVVPGTGNTRFSASNSVQIVGNAGVTSAACTVNSVTANTITVTVNSYTRGAAGALAAGAAIFIASSSQDVEVVAVYDNSANVPNEILIYTVNIAAIAGAVNVFGLLSVGR